MRLTLTHMLSFEANASPFSGLALDRLPMCSCVHVVEVPDVGIVQRYLKFQDGGASRCAGYPRMVETRRVCRSRLEAAYHRADTAIQRVVNLLAAA